MQKGLNLEALLTEVIRQNQTKRDFVADTKESIRMVAPLATDTEQTPKIVLLKEDSAQLERFEILENCHRQLAGRLNIPYKYYSRLLVDHLDLVLVQVNALLEREPATRLLRTLDGKARAFLSNRYRRLDNAEVLEGVLPAIVQGDIETHLLSSNVTDSAMHLKVLFTDPALKQQIGLDPKGNPDFVQPYAILRNSETGQGSLSLKAGFYRSFCTNGCIFGTEEAFNFKRNHIGGALIEGTDYEVFTDETKQKQDAVIISEVTDAFKALSDVDRANEMATKLRALKETDPMVDPFAGVDQMVKELDLREGDKTSILSTLLRDQDFSKWGALNAVTEMANTETVSYDRAQEIELVGAKIINLSDMAWNRIREAVPVAA